jgi:hypothetical protein
MDYTFASKINCEITSTASKRDKVPRGGYLDTAAIIQPTLCTTQNVQISNAFNLLELKCYVIILGCDQIKQHNPIGFDLRDESRQLTATTPVRVSQLEKNFRGKTVGYVVQSNLLQLRNHHHKQLSIQSLHHFCKNLMTYSHYRKQGFIRWFSYIR